MKLLICNIPLIKSAGILKLCKDLNIEVVNAKNTDYHCSVGSIFDNTISKKAKYDVKEEPKEMLVFYGFSSDNLDVFLAKYKQYKLPQILVKAVITPTNSAWSLAYLYKNLNFERITISSGK